MIIWLIAIVHAGSGVVFLPGLLPILLLGLIGFGGGYIYGYSLEPKSQTQGKPTEPIRKEVEHCDAAAEDASTNDGQP